MKTQARFGDHEFASIVYSEKAIARRIREMGREITETYGEGVDLLVLGLLKGSFIFLADLVRSIELSLQVDFLMVSSYGGETVSSGHVQLRYDPNATLEGKSVIVVEDIVDSGTTLNRLIPLLQERGPESLEICALLHKRLCDLVKEPRWVGFEAPPQFLVGYGLDFGEKFRHLPYIASL